MQLRTRQNHMIDFLFPAALLFVFAVSALTVILLAANIYRSTTAHSSLNHTAQASLAYISEKIHQNDMSQDVSIGIYNGCEALILEQTYNQASYRTYIYVYENELKELFAKKDTEFPPSTGKTIFTVEDFSMETVKDGLFRFSCTDAGGQAASAVVGIHSRNSSMQKGEQP